MDAKKVFWKAWVSLIAWSTVLALVIALALVITGIIYEFFWLSVFLAVVIIFLPLASIVIIRWQKRVEVPANWEYLYEWSGQKMAPLEPGLYYPFPYFGFLSEESRVLMNKQIIYIMSGSRDGLDSADVEKFVYGSLTDVEPGTGDFIRLKYGVEIQCTDSKKLVYERTDPFGFIAGLAEKEVVKFIKGLSGEDVNDCFVKRNWNKTVINKLQLLIEQETGVKIIRFIPIDVMNTPETEAARRAEEMKKREKAVLEAELKNMEVKEKISAKADGMVTHTINSVKTTAGVNGLVALKFITEKQKLSTIENASKNGQFTYMDSSGSGKLTDASAMGWGFHAHNSNAQPPVKNDVATPDDENQGGKKKVTVNKKK
jgi:hypothetical protein